MSPSGSVAPESAISVIRSRDCWLIEPGAAVTPEQSGERFVGPAKARLEVRPAAIAVTSERPSGTLHCPIVEGLPSQPQATTVPSLFNARL